MSNTKLNFDAARYCRHNAGRMGKWMDGEDIAGMIADDVERLRARVARLEEALRFILDECDWEESMATVCGDNRIGVAARRALGEK